MHIEPPSKKKVCKHLSGVIESLLPRNVAWRTELSGALKFRGDECPRLRSAWTVGLMVDGIYVLSGPFGGGCRSPTRFV
jgi:hypothetical protein